MKPVKQSIKSPASEHQQRMGAVFLVLVAVGSAYAAWRVFAPPSAAAVERDPSHVVESARQSVGAAKASSGSLPDVLPNDSLSALVRYEHAAEDYTLSSTMLGLRVTIGRDGNKKVEKGVQA